MKKVLLENTIKNFLIILVLIFTYPQIQTFFSNKVLDTSVIGNLLVAVSILAVTACFGNFAFTYEKVEHRNLISRLLAHITTGLLMLLIGLSLEMTSVLSALLVGDFFIFNLSLLILYVTSVLYDFWDLSRGHLAK